MSSAANVDQIVGRYQSARLQSNGDVIMVPQLPTGSPKANATPEPKQSPSRDDDAKWRSPERPADGIPSSSAEVDRPSIGMHIRRTRRLIPPPPTPSNHEVDDVVSQSRRSIHASNDKESPPTPQCPVSKLPPRVFSPPRDLPVHFEPAASASGDEGEWLDLPTDERRQSKALVRPKPALTKKYKKAPPRHRQPSSCSSSCSSSSSFDSSCTRSSSSTSSAAPHQQDSPRPRAAKEWKPQLSPKRRSTSKSIRKKWNNPFADQLEMGPAGKARGRTTLSDLPMPPTTRPSPERKKIPVRRQTLHRDPEALSPSKRRKRKGDDKCCTCS